MVASVGCLGWSGGALCQPVGTRGADWEGAMEREPTRAVLVPAPRAQESPWRSRAACESGQIGGGGLLSLVHHPEPKTRGSRSTKEPWDAAVGGLPAPFPSSWLCSWTSTT